MGSNQQSKKSVRVNGGNLGKRTLIEKKKGGKRGKRKKPVNARGKPLRKNFFREGLGTQKRKGKGEKAFTREKTRKKEPWPSRRRRRMPKR